MTSGKTRDFRVQWRDVKKENLWIAINLLLNCPSLHPAHRTSSIPTETMMRLKKSRSRSLNLSTGEQVGVWRGKGWAGGRGGAGRGGEAQQALTLSSLSGALPPSRLPSPLCPPHSAPGQHSDRQVCPSVTKGCSMAVTARYLAHSHQTHICLVLLSLLTWKICPLVLWIRNTLIARHYRVSHTHEGGHKCDRHTSKNPPGRTSVFSFRPATSTHCTACWRLPAPPSPSLSTAARLITSHLWHSFYSFHIFLSRIFENIIIQKSHPRKRKIKHCIL